jgi:hypothetical protein
MLERKIFSQHKASDFSPIFLFTNILVRVSDNTLKCLKQGLVILFAFNVTLEIDELEQSGLKS